jgi:hypothetical protein
MVVYTWGVHTPERESHHRGTSRIPASRVWNARLAAPTNAGSGRYHFASGSIMIKRILTRSAALVLFHFLSFAHAAEWAGAPMSWSPDSRWLSYTVVTGTGPGRLGSGWLFETERDQIRVPGSRASGGERQGRPARGLYRIWTTHRQRLASVLIAESSWPLSSPSWDPEGTAMAFQRFVPSSIDSSAARERGHFEVVIQNGLNRQHLLWSGPEEEIDAETASTLPQLNCTWNPDGSLLAIPRPGPYPAVVIVRTGSKKPLLVLDHALFPAWSPDGSRIAFLRPEDDQYSLQVIERHDASFGAPRPLLGIGRLGSRPLWSNDSHSILVVLEKTMSRVRELDVQRVFLERGESIRALPLQSEVVRLRRASRTRGVTIDWERERERCVFSVDQVGQDSAVGWGTVRDPEISKRFNPVDVSQRIGGLAVAPDGTTVALRFGTPDHLTPPALCDLASEHTTLLAPDETARQSWLSLLVGLARGLLVRGLPPAVVGTERAHRPTLLPLLGELSESRLTPPPPPADLRPPLPPPPAFPRLAPDDNDLPREIRVEQSLDGRLARIARLSLPLCGDGSDPAAVPPGEDGDTSMMEARIFFSYLSGNFAKVESDTLALEQRLTRADHRLAALALRAQVAWARGDQARARGMIDYLLATEGTERTRVEDTPLGPVIFSEMTPEQAWAAYLSARARVGPPEPPHVVGPADDSPELRLLDPPRLPGRPALEPGPAAIPFAPGRVLPFKTP